MTATGDPLDITPVAELHRRERHSDRGDAGAGMAGDGQPGCRQLLRRRSISSRWFTCCPWSWRRRSGALCRAWSRPLPALRRRTFSSIRRSTVSGCRTRRMSSICCSTCWSRLVTSNLAARLKNEAVTLSRREKEIRELHAFSQGLATCLTGRDLIFAVQDYLSNTLRYRAVLIATAPDDHDAKRQYGRARGGPAPGRETDRGQ